MKKGKRQARQGREEERHAVVSTSCSSRKLLSLDTEPHVCSQLLNSRQSDRPQNSFWEHFHADRRLHHGNPFLGSQKKKKFGPQKHVIVSILLQAQNSGRWTQNCVLLNSDMVIVSLQLLIRSQLVTIRRGCLPDSPISNIA